MIPTGETQSLSFRLNGQPLAVEVPPATSLLDLLRGPGGLTSVRAGCRIGRCGACTVLLDGRSVPACLVPAWRLDGRRVDTVEGLARDPHYQAVASALTWESALQCGYCTPGIVLSLVSCLRNETEPDRDRLAEALAGNLCRCTGYGGLRRALERLAPGRPRASHFSDPSDPTPGGSS